MALVRPKIRRGGPARRDAEVLGKYVLCESLGRGGMATVRRAELRGEAGFRRVVALKQLHPHLAAIPDLVALFAREARLGSYLSHTNIAHTFDFGSVDGSYYIAMELIRGPTLAQLARQCASAAGPIPMAIVIGILIQLCDAFDYIHRACDPKGQPLHLVHCDVSPSNIIIANTGVVKLIDFGIARAASAQFRAETGMLRSRLAYLAPEYQDGTLDVRSDLFSLGAIGYEMIANQPLFAGGGDELRRVREMPIPPMSRAGRVPHALQDIIMTALQRDLDQRWQTAAEIRAALQEVVRGMGIHIAPPQIAAWVAWAYSQRARPEGATPLVVVPASVRGPTARLEDAARARGPGAASDDSWAIDGPTKLRRRPSRSDGMYLLRRARRRAPRLASPTLPVTREFLRAATRYHRSSAPLRPDPMASAVGVAADQRPLAHTVARDLPGVGRGRGLLAAGTSGTYPAVPEPAVLVPPRRSADPPGTHARVALRPDATPARPRRTQARNAALPQTAPSATHAPPSPSAIHPAATARTSMRMAAMPAPSAAAAAAVAASPRRPRDSTGVVVVPAPARASQASRETPSARRARTARVSSSLVPWSRAQQIALLAALGALVAFVLAYLALRR